MLSIIFPKAGKRGVEVPVDGRSGTPLLELHGLLSLTREAKTRAKEAVIRSRVELEDNGDVGQAILAIEDDVVDLVVEQATGGFPGRTVSLTPKDFASTFNVDRLRHLMIDLTLMDASATHEDFSVGMSGQVSSTKTNDVSPYHVPFPFRLPRNAQRRMAEVVISDYLVNSILYHAHRTNSLLFHVDSKVPVIGSVLKTTCGPDEVCLADQVEEIGEAFPNKKLELIIRTTRPPVISFHKGKLSITRLSFIDGVDFFGLDVNDLDGLRKTTKMALENMANAIFSAGIPLTSSTLESLRLSALHVTVLPGVVLLQANVDLYSSFYNHS
ncbi:unnamed protein product [Heligmosomoides polygyrus]|uniref:BPI2 domain-containing protein n=1 Tax=Heligmosomoides polygyrus TaxID=6339 RepID=A0A183G8D7_HELPZ|nr:unnamed protein product [Heligmosomoides polygyrus]